LNLYITSFQDTHAAMRIQTENAEWCVQIGLLCIICIMLHLTWRGLILKPQVSSSSLSLSLFVCLFSIHGQTSLYDIWYEYDLYVHVRDMVHTHLCHFESHSDRIWKDSYWYDGSLMESQTKFPPFGPLGSETGETAEGVIRRLRDSLEISGHDKNHPHAAAPQPDQDSQVHGLVEFKFQVSPPFPWGIFSRKELEICNH